MEKWLEAKLMSNSNMLEIIQGLAQAAANAYDGSHDVRTSYDAKERRVGLRREEGCPIHDSRMMDGFKVKFHGDSMCITYQSDIRLKEVYAGGFEQEMEHQIQALLLLDFLTRLVPLLFHLCLNQCEVPRESQENIGFY